MERPFYRPRILYAPYPFHMMQEEYSQSPSYMSWPMMQYPPTVVDEDSEIEFWKEMYPDKMKKIQNYVEETCDKLDYDGSAKVISEVKEDGYVLSGYEGVIFPEITLDAVIENKERFKYIANVYDKDSYLKIMFGFNLFEELSDFVETCIDHGKYVEVYKPNND